MLGRDAQAAGDVGLGLAAALAAGAERPAADGRHRGGGRRGAPGCRREADAGGSARAPVGGRPSAACRSTGATASRRDATSHGGSSLNDPRDRSAGAVIVGRSLRLGGAAELPGDRAGDVGRGTRRGRSARRLGGRRRQGRDPGRRPDAPAVPAAGRPRPTRVAAVRPRQPGQAEPRRRPGPARGRSRCSDGCWPTPTCSSPTCGPRRWSAWVSAPTRCWRTSPASSTPASAGTGSTDPTWAGPATTSARSGPAAASPC